MHREVQEAGVQLKVDVQYKDALAGEFIKAVLPRGTKNVSQILDDFLPGESASLAAFVKKNQVEKFSKSGGLLNAIQGRVVRVKNVSYASVGVFNGSSIAYAGVQESGTKPPNSESPFPLIRSPRAFPGGALAIPLTAAAKNIPAKDYPGLKYVRIKPKRGSPVVGLLVRTRSVKGRLLLGRLNAVYLLLSYVKLKPKKYLEKGTKKYLPTFIKHLKAFMQERFDE